MKDLFSPSRVSRVDESKVYAYYERWPELAVQGLSGSVGVPRKDYRRVVLLGMGGSASAGDIISGWLFARDKLEVAVYKGSLPKGDMDGTLALACSASGGTVETIGMAKAASELGATLVTITGGGKLEEMALSAHSPYVSVPKAKAPRYMLPFMLFACLGVIDEALGLSARREAESAADALAKAWAGIRAEVPETRNPAKSLALDLRRATAKVYGTRLTRGVGVRFCTAVNENAKANAFFEEVPEVMHNDVESWEAPDGAFIPVILKTSADDPTLTARMGWFASSIRKKGSKVLTMEGIGGTSLAELCSLTYRLDMASYYLAILRGVDPLPTRLLTSLRHRLGSS